MTRTTLKVSFAVALSTTLLVVSCTSSGSHEVSSGPGAPVEPGAVMLRGAAPVGADLALLVSPRADLTTSLVLLRSPDGTLMELPELPSGGAFRIGSAGKNVLVGGVACAEGPRCEVGREAIYQLGPGDDRWTQILDGRQSSSEVEKSVTPGPSQFAWFAIGESAFLVDAAGEISVGQPELEPAGFGGATFSCVLSDRQVAIPATNEPAVGITGINALASASGPVYELSFDRMDEGWVETSPTPDGVVNLGGATECGASTMSVHLENGTQFTFDAITRQWSSGPSNWRELTGSSVFMPRQPGEIAEAVGGDHLYAVVDGRLLSKARGELWQVTGRAATSVYATEGGVVVVNESPNGSSFEML